MQNGGEKAVKTYRQFHEKHWFVLVRWYVRTADGCTYPRPDGVYTSKHYLELLDRKLDAVINGCK